MAQWQNMFINRLQISWKLFWKKENFRQEGSLSVTSYICYVKVVAFVRVSNKRLLYGIYKDHVYARKAVCFPSG